MFGHVFSVFDLLLIYVSYFPTFLLFPSYLLFLLL